MAQYVHGYTKTFTASGAITENALVKVVASSSTTPPQVIECTGAAGEDINVVGTAAAAAASGAVVTVNLLNACGSVKVIADVADVDVGDTLFTAAGGEVTDQNTSGTVVGVALEASSAAGDIVEMAPKATGDDGDSTT